MLSGLVACITLLTSCGGTSETGNARLSSISGALVQDAQPVAGANVIIVAHDYTPGTDSSKSVFISSTDKNGNYHFENVPHGSYYVNGNSGIYRSFSGPYIIDEPEKDIATDTLKQPARLSIVVQDTQTISFVYIRGTTELIPVINQNVIIENAPVGNLSLIGGKFDKPVSTTIKTTFQSSRILTLKTYPDSNATVAFRGKDQIFITNFFSLTDTLLLDGSLYEQVLEIDDFATGNYQFELLTAPSGMVIDPDSGIITWMLDTSIAPATYRVSVKVTKVSATMSDTASWDLAVRKQVDVATGPFLYGSDSGITGQEITFFGDSSLSPNVKYRFFWDDGSSSEELTFPSASHHWVTSDTYNVYFMAITGEEQIDTIRSNVHQIIISGDTRNPGRILAQISTSPDSIVRPTTLKLFQPVWVHIDIADSACGTMPYAGIIWGDTTTSNYLQVNTFSHSYRTPGIYYLQAVTGCQRWQLDTATSFNIDSVIVLDEVIVDTTAPVITLVTNDTTTNYMVGDTFIDPGYLAWDDTEKDITERVLVYSDGLTDSVFTRSGWITIIYSVKDMLGNRTEVNRSVYVNQK